MARTATAVKQAPSKSEASTPTYRHATRALSSYSSNSTYIGSELDDFCQMYVDQGYRLHSFHPTYIKGEQGPDGTLMKEAQWHILYLFVKD